MEMGNTQDRGRKERRGEKVKDGKTEGNLGGKNRKRKTKFQCNNVWAKKRILRNCWISKWKWM